MSGAKRRVKFRYFAQRQDEGHFHTINTVNFQELLFYMHIAISTQSVQARKLEDLMGDNSGDLYDLISVVCSALSAFNLQYGIEDIIDIMRALVDLKVLRFKPQKWCGIDTVSQGFEFIEQGLDSRFFVFKPKVVKCPYPFKLKPPRQMRTAITTRRKRNSMVYIFNR